MRKFFATMTLFASLMAFTACDDSASGDSEGSKGSFPQNGDPSFYCEVTSGEGWAQIKVNIPGYMGRVEKFSYDAATETATKYYEESYYKLTEFEKAEMCLEYDRDIKNNKKKNVTDYYCGNGVFYMVVSATNASRYKEEVSEEAVYFKERCLEYEEDWNDGVYDSRNRD